MTVFDIDDLEPGLYHIFKDGVFVTTLQIDPDITEEDIQKFMVGEE